MLEFRRGETGIPLKGREGLWQPYPVEYKRGKPKEGTEDTLQLCGQAMCLEEHVAPRKARGLKFKNNTAVRIILTGRARKGAWVEITSPLAKRAR